ncbi:MAG TPA: phosphatidylinositol mannoside acyltransferase [Actinomycetota bacterium]
MSETFGERMAYAMYAAAERAATSLPEPAGRKLFAGIAAVQHRSAAKRQMVGRNLARVLGEPLGSPVLRAAVREAFDSYARYWYDTFRLRVMPPEEVRKRMQLVGTENVDAALEPGRGVVIALPHMGNWDAAGNAMVLAGYRVTAVAENLRPPRLMELFRRHREELGMGIVVLDESRGVGEKLVKQLSENVLIALVADRDLKGRGVEVEMFGATRRMPAGPALLSLGTGAPLIPAAVYDTDDDGWVTVLEPPIEVERTARLRDDVTALTRKLAARFEHAIASAPTQWHMWQPAWPEGS